MRSIFEWIGMKAEDEILKHSQEHFNKVLQTVKELEKAVKSFVENDVVNMRKYIHNVAQYEHEADVIRRNLIINMSKGEILPQDRSDLMNFVIRIDALADWAHTSGRFLALWEGEIPPEFKKELVVFMGTTISAVEKLKNVVELIGKENEQKILELCAEVESAEEIADDQHRDILKIILRSNLSTAQIIVAHDLIEAIENISDACEIVADSLSILAVEISGR